MGLAAPRYGRQSTWAGGGLGNVERGTSVRIHLDHPRGILYKAGFERQFQDAAW